MKKLCTVVMLATEDYSNIMYRQVDNGKEHFDLELVYDQEAKKKSGLNKPYHLFIISEDREEWREGDYIHTTNIPIEKIKGIDKEYSTQPNYEWLITVEGNGNQYKPCEIYGKIIATTDPRSELPKIPMSFIEKFIKTEEGFLEVSVDYKHISTCTEGEDCPAYTGESNNGVKCEGEIIEGDFPVLSESNEIIISTFQRTHYTTKEITSLLRKALHRGMLLEAGFQDEDPSEYTADDDWIQRQLEKLE